MNNASTDKQLTKKILNSRITIFSFLRFVCFCMAKSNWVMWCNPDFVGAQPLGEAGRLWPVTLNQTAPRLPNRFPIGPPKHETAPVFFLYLSFFSIYLFLLFIPSPPLFSPIPFFSSESCCQPGVASHFITWVCPISNVLLIS